MRIVQLSDLRVGSQDFRELETSFVKDVIDAVQNFPFDYFVVCGNVTAQGDPGQFRQAHNLLKNLFEELTARHLIPRDSDDRDVRANRVILVPGKKDVQDGSSRTPNSAFADFYTSFFAEVFHAERQPTPFDRPLVLQLKELTFVGLSYWHDDKIPGSERFQSILRADPPHDSLRNVLYCRTTPTVLVSAETPVLDSSVRAKLHRHEYLRSVLEDDLRLDLHLFGAGPVNFVIVEPFVFKHIVEPKGLKMIPGFSFADVERQKQYINFLTAQRQSASGHAEAQEHRRDQDTGPQIG